MSLHPIFAWLYWNPPRELFTIPWINRPIAFYGLFFVMGFVIGYFLLSYMLKKKLLFTKKIYERDIRSWPALINYLQLTLNRPDDFLFPIAQQLDRKLFHDISHFHLGQGANNQQKSAILEAINKVLLDGTSNLDKATLEILMPKAFIQAKDFAYMLTDKLTWFVVLGTIIGARLGHVIFYDWPRYQNNWADIIKVWEGGLASHGGVLGVLFGVFLYQRYILKRFPEITLIGLIDCMVVPAALIACLIRVGNFFNQELMGPFTTVPWAIIFGDPADKEPIVPRHPTQLYEASAYLIIFSILLFLWKTRLTALKPGVLSGLLFILIFGARILIDFVKTPQSMIIDESVFQMGQYLSIPFILLGFFLFFFGQKIDSRFNLNPSSN